MCGIAFVINYNQKKKIDLDMIGVMFSEMESRGTDSAGYYFERIENTKMVTRCIKAPTTASDLYAHIHWDKHTGKAKKYFDQYKLNGTERLIMLHTRNKTQGSEFDNNNNMPIFSQHYVLIHNGVIHSPRLKKYEYSGDVDSEEILARIETLGVEDGLQAVRGSMAVAFKKFESDKMYFGKRSSPLDLVYLANEKMLIGISEHKFVEIKPEDSMLSKILFSPSTNIVEMPDKMLYRVDLKSPKVEYECSIDVKFGGAWKKDVTGNKWIPNTE